MASQIATLAEIRSHLLHRLRHQVATRGDAVLGALLHELTTLCAQSAPADDPFATFGGVLVPLRLRTPLGEVSLFSTITVFGTPTDVTLSELALESFFPGDADSADILRRIAQDATSNG
jgi:hypothetical protein